MRPELLILDEPTTGLDPAVRLALWSRIRELRAAGTTVLITTHYMDEAQRLCDQVAIVSAGKVIASGAPAELITTRLAPEAVEFDCAPSEEAALLDGYASGRRLRVGRRLVLYVDDATNLIDANSPPRRRRPPPNHRPAHQSRRRLSLSHRSQPGGQPVSISLPYALAVWRRNAAMYKRTWKWNILPNFFEPVFYLFSIGLGVGAYISEMGGTSYLAFIAPGLVCVAAMNGASFEVTYNIYVRLVFEKTYDAMLTTPIEPDDVLVGEILWAVTRSCVYGGCFFVVLMLFGLTPLPSSLSVIFVIPMTGLLFAAIGMVFSLRIPNIDMFSFYFTLFLTPLFLFSDVFFPLKERLTGAWLWVAEALPLLHPVRLARASFRGEFSAIVFWDLAYTLGMSLLLLLWARRSVRDRLTN